MTGDIAVRDGGLSDDGAVADHFRRMWLDNAIPALALVPTWRARTTAFLKAGRDTQGALSLVAHSSEEHVGTLVAQRYGELYPDVLERTYRHYAYIWGVYVEPAWRRKGIARRLVVQAIERLRDEGYSRVYLHASPMGVPLYQSLGFQPGNEMRLGLEA